MKIKIFAPVSGWIEKIENIEDDVFKSKDLGDGFFIKPNKGEIYSPLENSQITMIFPTKHAYFIENEFIKCLVHIGLETVGLGGEGFDGKVKLDQIVNNTDELTKVDLALLRKKQIKDHVVVTFLDHKEQKVNIHLTVENANVKQGQEIGLIEVEDEKNSVKKKNKSKWLGIANELIQFVGGNDNFSSYYNCMTRMRFTIKDKSKVSTEKIKNVDEVKGINWNGNELQIIIGGSVVKVKEQIDFKLKSKTQNKSSIKQKIFQFISGVMVPGLPVLMASGLLSGIQAILVQFNVIVGTGDVTTMDLFSALMYIGSKVGLEMIGVIFCYNTVKYLGGNPVMGIFLGMALTSRYFLGAGFGTNAGYLEHNGTGFILFKLFGNPIYIKAYVSSIIPLISAGLFLHYFDLWVKKWMPGAIDIVFRPALVFTVSFTAVLFIVGPITGIIEQTLGQIVITIGNLPLGIGVGVTAGVWQLLVLTGTHIAVANAIKLPIMNMQSSALAAIFGIAILAQMGAAIGVFIRTKDEKTKQAVAAALPSIVFGISEPTIYGINVPKVRPFIAGCFAAFAGGMFSGILGLDAEVIGGGGFLQILWFTDNVLEMALYGLVLVSTIVLASCLSVIMYIEKPSEKVMFKREINKLHNYLVIKEDVNKKLSKQFIKNLLLESKEELNQYTQLSKLFEKIVLSVKKDESKLDKLKLKKESTKKIEMIQKFENKLTQSKEIIKDKKAELIMSSEKIAKKYFGLIETNYGSTLCPVEFVINLKKSLQNTLVYFNLIATNNFEKQLNTQIDYKEKIKIVFKNKGGL